MYFFAFEKLETLLNIRKKKKVASTIIRKSRGPARINKWGVLQNARNIFVTTPSSTAQTKTRKKIILSDDLLKDRALTELDFDLFRALLRHYDVYLWPG